jgi:hypothetical protein
MPKRLAGRPRLLGVIAAALALVVVIVGVSAARKGDPPVRPARYTGPTVPGHGGRVAYGAAVRGRCLTVDHARMNVMRGWGVYTFSPGRAPALGPAGRRLLPLHFAPTLAPPGLDAFASGSTRPSDLTQWQVAGIGRQMPASPASGCAGSIQAAAPDASVKGQAIALRRPGPYVYWTFEHTVRWVKVSDSGPEPTPTPCAQNASPTATNPAPTGAPPSVGGPTWHWAVTRFCTTVRWWNFTVLGSRGSCGTANSGYINQYSAGVRLHLPLGRGKAGGNACGPSALLMAMLQSERSQRGKYKSLPSLERVFDQTMQRPRRKVTANGDNEFLGTKAGILLRKLGWGQAMMGRLGTSAASIADEASDSDPTNQAAIDRALNDGPVVLSTALGPEPWGTTGEGHMIVVLGRDPANPGEYIVYDPAGNYFSDPVNHYGPASCGSGVLYPANWLLAFTGGAWYLKLGSPPGHVKA